MLEKAIVPEMRSMVGSSIEIRLYHDEFDLTANHPVKQCSMELVARKGDFTDTLMRQLCEDSQSRFDAKLFKIARQYKLTAEQMNGVVVE